MTDNKSAFAVNQYDENVRKVIPFYDEIYEQIFSVINAHCGDKPLAVLDSGCGTGNFGVMALERQNLSELVLCDPSEKMLANARKKLNNQACKYHCIGSEKLDFENRFDVVTAIQSHHYFDRATRETAVRNCFKALKAGGIFICFENTAPFTEYGVSNMLKRLEEISLRAVQPRIFPDNDQRAFGAAKKNGLFHCGAVLAFLYAKRILCGKEGVVCV